nr:MAG TPA: hypothetical protein [Caudoviricetes sp.]
MGRVSAPLKLLQPKTVAFLLQPISVAKSKKYLS